MKLITSGKESDYKMFLLLGHVDLDTLVTPGYYSEAMYITWDNGEGEKVCEQYREDGNV